MTFMSACSCNNEKVKPDGDDTFNRYTASVPFESKILGRQMPFSIILPSDYVSSPKKRYPVVYLLHGYGDNCTSWNDQYLHVQTKIEELESSGLEPMIYILPTGKNSYYCNYYDGSYRYMDMFVEEFVPYIDKTFRTIADRDHRAVIGYSMGGFGAIILPMKHPEMFSISVPLSMSWRTNEQYLGEPQNGWDNQFGVIFGGVGKSGEGRITEYFKAHNPYYQFTPENKASLSTVKWFLHCGDDEERLCITNDELHCLLAGNCYEHEWRIADGAHTSSYWRNTLTEVLPYIQNVMNGGGKWQFRQVDIDTPDVAWDENKVFCSAKFASSDKATAVYFVHKGLSDKLVKDAVATIQKYKSTSFAIMPCDLSIKTLAEWKAFYEPLYFSGSKASARYAIGVGDGGKAIYDGSADFSALFFVEAGTGTDDPVVSKSKTYCMVQSSHGAYYRDLCSLYEACKKVEPSFQYRCLCTLEDESENLLHMLEVMKFYFNP